MDFCNKSCRKVINLHEFLKLIQYSSLKAPNGNERWYGSDGDTAKTRQQYYNKIYSILGG